MHRVASEVTAERLIPTCEAVQSVTELTLPPRAKSIRDRPVLVRFVIASGRDKLERSMLLRLFLRITSTTSFAPSVVAALPATPASTAGIKLSRALVVFEGLIPTADEIELSVSPLNAFLI